MTHPDGEPEAEFGLVMPFVSVKSRGGPWDDQSFAAGWEMGLLDATLGNPLVQAGVPAFTRTILQANAAQADLLAMRHGWTTSWSPWCDVWTEVEFTRDVDDTKPAEEPQ